MSTREIVVGATERLFNQKDLTAVDDLFGPVYVQHSALAPDGIEGLRGLVSGLSESAGYELVRALADQDLVVTHGVFSGFAPVPLIGYDVWRVRDGRIVEHWDALGPASAPTGDGRSQTSGPGLSPGAHDTTTNKALVERLVQRVLIERADENLTDYLAPELVEHDPAYPGGIDGFREALRAQVVTYDELHMVLADADFVYTRSQGTTDLPVIINDLWRIGDGRVAEHWSLTAPVPPYLPHGNGAF
ncbi:nuclear transport factor 2 family protein [Promicromonospora sp. NPDC052451]|uniref:nuclear transport factor 2 family protein n=1 Tax=Promicromonospora sp. NPDC052451 TaxID=3364407 RepID=UPI0037C8741C